MPSSPRSLPAPSAPLRSRRSAATSAAEVGFASLASPLVSSFIAFSFVVCAAGLVGCGPGEPPAPPPPTVKVVQVTPRATVAFEEYVARIAASNTVEIRPQVKGRLETQAAVEGQRVQKGALLFQIDSDPYAAALARAEANQAEAEARLAQAHRDLERVKSLASSNVASEQALDAKIAEEKAASASVHAAVAVVRTAKLELDYTRVTSPIDGVVGRAEVRIGAAVEAYDTLLTRVYANDPMYVEFGISEQRMLELQHDYGPDLAKGASDFKIVLADGSEYPHRGTLDFVDQALDAKTATLPMRLVVPNPDGLLRENQFARVVLPVDANPNALVVPVRAVQAFQGSHSVWVVDAKGQVENRAVDVGQRVDGEYVIRGGIAVGERVVVDGVQKLRPGITVDASTGAVGDVAAEPGAAPEVRNGS